MLQIDQKLIEKLYVKIHRAEREAFANYWSYFNRYSDRYLNGQLARNPEINKKMLQLQKEMDSAKQKQHQFLLIRPFLLSMCAE